MNSITDSYLIAHSLELRLLLALLVIVISVLAIKVSLFVARIAGPLLAKSGSTGSGHLPTSVYSAVGTR